MGQVKTYDTQALIAAIVKRDEPLTRVALRFGLSARYVQLIAQGKARADLQPRLAATRQGMQDELRRLGATYGLALLAQHIRQGMEGTTETARRCREFVLTNLAMFKPPDGAAANAANANAAPAPVDPTISSDGTLPDIASICLDPDGPIPHNYLMYTMDKAFRRRVERAVDDTPIEFCTGDVWMPDAPEVFETVCHRECTAHICKMSLADRRWVRDRWHLLRDARDQARYTEQLKARAAAAAAAEKDAETRKKDAETRRRGDASKSDILV